MATATTTDTSGETGPHTTSRPTTQPEHVRSTLPRHKRGQWIGPGRNKKATAPDAQGVVTLSPHEFLDRLADLVPPPRKHRHRYHGVFAPNHPLRPAVTALAVGNVRTSSVTATGLLIHRRLDDPRQIKTAERPRCPEHIDRRTPRLRLSYEPGHRLASPA